MGTDFSRVRLDALRDYAGVELKQGAVLLDGDANEGTDIVDRRLRALAGDMLGRVIVSATTPDAFEIKAAAGGLTIGIGRLYVDGLLAECHGGDPAVHADKVFDSLLAEPKFAKPLPYEAQPYMPLLPAPPGPAGPPPILPKSGRHLVYLDVWNREVTHLEQPELVEIAVGVEASSRIQTVWQVRLLEDIGSDTTCSSSDCDLPGWADLIAPSTGVLTTGTYDIEPPKDPCELPPTGGYRGLENQLYRVEIHDPGQAGVATFKWSRDNASVGSRVASIVSNTVSGTVSETVLELESIGRDDVLSFKTNDWVEITDDVRELAPQPGGKFAPQPGVFRKVTVDAARRRITFSPALPGDMLPPAASLPNGTFPQDRNLRVRRWDQSGPIYRTDLSGIPVEIQDLDKTGQTGLITVPPSGTGLILEQGVMVKFEPGANGFRSGDYWVFAARTADASVEGLVAAPPRGVHHHYARLAIWNADEGTVTDCRPKRPAGCCTFVVSPGESIQAAIDALPAAGGCICLKAGLHLIDAPIIIARDNVSLHGESMGATVRSPGGGTLLVIGGAGDFRAREVRISSIVFQQGAGELSSIVVVPGADSVIVEDCRMETGQEAGYGLIALDSTDLKVLGTEFLHLWIGAWCSEGCRDVTISGCQFRASVDAAIPSGAAIIASKMSGAIVVEDNLVVSSYYGVIVNDDLTLPPHSDARGSRVCGNRISISGGSGLPQRIFAIDVAAEASIVSDNHIDHVGGNLAAIRLAGSGSSARGNVIRSSAVRATGTMLSEPSIAIVAGDERGDKFLPLERLVIADNVVEGIQHGILLAGTARSRVSGNILGSESSGAENGIVANRATDCILSDNLLGRYAYGLLLIHGARNTVRGNSLQGGGWGIAFNSEEAPTISGNRLEDLAQHGIIIWGATQRCNVIENRIIHCGSAATTALGLVAWNVQGELHVEGNEVMDLGVSRSPNGPKAGLAWGISAEDIFEARIESNLITYSSPLVRDPSAEDRALRLRGFRDAPPSPANPFGSGFAAQITNNKFIGPGASALVELFELQISANDFRRFERVLFHGNYCSHFTLPREEGVTVSLVGRRCSITGNHVRSLLWRVPSYDLHNMPGPFIGNVSQGFSGRTAQMPNPESSFNTNT